MLNISHYKVVYPCVPCDRKYTGRRIQLLLQDKQECERIINMSAMHQIENFRYRDAILWEYPDLIGDLKPSLKSGLPFEFLQESRDKQLGKLPLYRRLTPSETAAEWKKSPYKCKTWACHHDVKYEPSFVQYDVDNNGNSVGKGYKLQEDDSIDISVTDEDEEDEEEEDEYEDEEEDEESLAEEDEEYEAEDDETSDQETDEESQEEQEQPTPKRRRLVKKSEQEGTPESFMGVLNVLTSSMRPQDFYLEASLVTLKSAKDIFLRVQALYDEKNDMTNLLGDVVLVKFLVVAKKLFDSQVVLEDSKAVVKKQDFDLTMQLLTHLRFNDFPLRMTSVGKEVLLFNQSYNGVACSLLDTLYYTMAPLEQSNIFFSFDKALVDDKLDPFPARTVLKHFVYSVDRVFIQAAHMNIMRTVVQDVVKTESTASSGIFNMDKILAHRRFGRTTKYLIRWEGYSKEHDTWEPAENLPVDVLAEYKKLNFLA